MNEVNETPPRREGVGEREFPWGEVWENRGFPRRLGGGDV